MHKSNYYKIYKFKNAHLLQFENPAQSAIFKYLVLPSRKNCQTFDMSLCLPHAHAILIPKAESCSLVILL